MRVSSRRSIRAIASLVRRLRVSIFSPIKPISIVASGTGERRKRKDIEQQTPAKQSDKRFSALEKSLESWVENKMYCEYDKTRDQIAAELNTTKEILHLYFVTKKGEDFRTWRTMLRIEEAKKLLLENKDASINIIAETSGFSDKSNFHRQFVKIVGCSPKQWRDSDGKVGDQ